MSDEKKSISVFFEGEIRDLQEAGALFLNRLIEEDLPNTEEFPTGVDPYKWLVDKIGKNERSIRAWTYDWRTDSGTKPTIIDFCNLIRISKSQRAVSFVEHLIMEGSVEEHSQKHADLMESIAAHMRELADKIEALSGRQRSE